MLGSQVSARRYVMRFQVPNGGRSLITYEALLRTMFATVRVTGLCLYDHGFLLLHGAPGALSWYRCEDTNTFGLLPVN
jgi:hypothetical protein